MVAAFLVALAGFVPARAQQLLQAGLLPSVNLNADLSRQYSLNLKAESRHSLLSGQTEEGVSFRYRHALTDFAFVVSRRIGLRHRLAAGYQIRFRDGHIIHRAIQQFTLVRALNALRLGHRFAADQTFHPERDLLLRLRYRLTLELPLSGAAVDPREFYLKGNNEYLVGFEGDTEALEIRLVPALGYVFSDDNKLEGGLDYRLSSLLAKGSVHRMWLALSWYLRW